MFVSSLPWLKMLWIVFFSVSQIIVWTEAVRISDSSSWMLVEHSQPLLDLAVWEFHRNFRQMYKSKHFVTVATYPPRFLWLVTWNCGSPLPTGTTFLPKFCKGYRIRIQSWESLSKFVEGLVVHQGLCYIFISLPATVFTCENEDFFYEPESLP